LIGCTLGGKGVINFNKFTDAAFHITLWRIDTFKVEKLKLVI